MNNLYLLKYDSENLGDDIQTIAVMDILQDLQLHNSFVYRDLISGYFFNPLHKNYVILNGWFTNGYGLDVYYSVTDETKPLINVTWPPKGNFIPILYSFHISEWGAKGTREVNPKFLDQESIDFYTKGGRVGCRDTHTLNVLEKLGVPAYLSNCITLSFDKNKYTKSNCPNNEILMVDVPQPYKNSLIPKIASYYEGQVGFKSITHSISSYSTDIIDRLSLAKRHLQAFCNAKLVVTSRLHVALPCLAFGTPLIFICDDEDLDNSRFVDYLQYMNVLKYSEVDSMQIENYLSSKYDGLLSQKVKSNFIEKITSIIA